MSRPSLPSANVAGFGTRMGSSTGVWLPRLLALLVWSAVAAGAVYWGLSLTTRSQPVPAHAVVTGGDGGLRGDLGRLFGAPAGADASAAAPVAAPPAASRFKVLGVVGSVRGGAGVVLLSVDGKAPKAYPVGAVIEGEWRVETVTQKLVRLGPAQGKGDVLQLELAALPPAATGLLPGPEAGATPATGAAMVPTNPSGRPLGAPPVPMAVPAPAVIAPPQVVTPPQVRPDGTVVPPDPVASAAGG